MHVMVINAVGVLVRASSGCRNWTGGVVYSTFKCSSDLSLGPPNNHVTHRDTNLYPGSFVVS